MKKSDVRYEKLGYSRMRVSLLYGKKYMVSFECDMLDEMMKVLGVERIKMSVVLEILKKSDVRYEKLGYSRMRVLLS